MEIVPKDFRSYREHGMIVSLHLPSPRALGMQPVPEAAPMSVAAVEGLGLVFGQQRRRRAADKATTGVRAWAIES